MTDLWSFASEEAEREADGRSLAMARVASAGYWPIIAKARDEEELDHAVNLASEGITAMVASICDEPAGVAVLASRVMDSYRDDWKAFHAALVAEGTFTRQHFNAIAKALHDYQTRSGQQIPGLADHFAGHLAGGNALFDPSRFKNAVNEGVAGSLAFDANNMTKEHFQTLANAISSAPIRHRAGLANHFADLLAGSNPRFKRDVFMRAANPTSQEHGRAAILRTAGTPGQADDPGYDASIAAWENEPYEDRIAWQGDADASAHTALITDAPSYGSGGPNDNFGFPAIQDDNEAEEVENAVAAWEGADHQQRVDMGNGLGVSDVSSGPNVTTPASNSGEEPLLHSSSLDPELGLPEGYYRLDRYGAFIHVAIMPHQNDFSNADLHLHMQQHHPEMNSGYANNFLQSGNRQGLEELHQIGHMMGSEHDHRHEPSGTFASKTGEAHPPYYIREDGGTYKVVDRLGKARGEFDSRDAAREQQKALYANVSGASEKAEQMHGHTPEAVQEAGKKAHKGIHLAAVAKARSLVDEMPIQAQAHAVAKAMLVRARQYNLSEDETDLVVNAAIERWAEVHDDRCADCGDKISLGTNNSGKSSWTHAHAGADHPARPTDDVAAWQQGIRASEASRGRLGFTRQADASDRYLEDAIGSIPHGSHHIFESEGLPYGVSYHERQAYGDMGQPVHRDHQYTGTTGEFTLYHPEGHTTEHHVGPSHAAKPYQAEQVARIMRAKWSDAKIKRLMGGGVNHHQSGLDTGPMKITHQAVDSLTGQPSVMHLLGPGYDDPDDAHLRAHPEIRRMVDRMHVSTPEHEIADMGARWAEGKGWSQGEGPHEQAVADALAVHRHNQDEYSHVMNHAPWPRSETAPIDPNQQKLFARRKLADGVSQEKRDRAEESGDTLPGTDKFPIENRSDLEKAKHDIGRTNEPHDKVVRYIDRKAEELGAPGVGEKESVLNRLWSRLTGRTAAGNPANPFDPSSTANQFSPAQDANSAMNSGPAAANQSDAMDPSNEPPNEIDQSSTTAVSSKPRTKPSSNPNAPQQPQPTQMMGPAGIPLTSQPMMAAKVAIAEKILSDNPEMTDEAALRLATSTINRFPHLVVEAYGGADYLGDAYPGEGGAASCYQCGKDAMDPRTGHCHFCGAVQVGWPPREGWDQISGSTTIAPGPADLRNPGTR